MAALSLNNAIVAGGDRSALSISSPPITRFSHRSSLRLSSRASHVASAAESKNRSGSRAAGRFDGRNRRGSPGTRTKEQEEVTGVAVDGGGEIPDDGFVMPVLEGQEPDFWEGNQWDGIGFFVQYMWAFGIGFALIACGIAVATYNEGATDFKETPAYKESVQSQEFLEEPEASSSNIFESNPTEEAPNLD